MSTRPGTLGEIVVNNARRFPDVSAYTMGDESISHSELLDRAVKLVAALAAAGVRRQDRIAVIGRNGLRFGELIAATQTSGIILAPINFRLTVGKIAAAIKLVRPVVVFCDGESAHAKPRRATCPWVPTRPAA